MLTGHYVYIETSAVIQGSYARLISQEQPATTLYPACQVVFYYHMFGFSIGTLRLAVERLDGSPHQVHGTFWFLGVLPACGEKQEVGLINLAVYM